MTRRLFLTFLASTSLVLMGFLVPLWITVGSLVEAQAQNTAVREVQPVVAQLPQVVPAEQAEYVDSRNAEGRLTVYLSDGRQLGTPAPITADVTLAQRGSFFVDTTEGLVLYSPITDMPEGTAVVRHLTPADLINQPLLIARASLLALGVVLLIVAGLVTWRLARSFLRPIGALADTADRLGSGDLTARVEPDGPPEIHEIGTLLNRLADRIEELLHSEREGVADLAHRLRTPVTALRLDADSLRDPEERARLSRDVDRMASMVDNVIHEARRPVREGVSAGCDAVLVVRDRVAFWSVLAEDQGRALSVDTPEGQIPVRVSADDLGDALDALIGNVFSHTPEAIPFRVSVTARPEGGAEVTVSDGGPGLVSTGIERGRSNSGSTGLGLDIASRTAQASGGRLDIAAASPLGGARVTLILGPASVITGATTRKGTDRQPRPETEVTGM